MAENTRVVIQLTGDASGLKKAIDEVDRELGQLVVQTDRAQAALGSGMGRAAQQVTKQTNAMNNSLRTATTATKQLTRAQQDQLRAGRRMRGGLQNLGFQAQDIAVQFEMGTHWTRIFTQQGTQILGVFGPMATIIGAVAAGLIIAGKAFFDFKAEVKSTTEEIDVLKEAFAELGAARDEAFQFGQTGSSNPFMQQLVDGRLAAAVDDLNDSLGTTNGAINKAFGDTGLGEAFEAMDRLQQQAVAGSEVAQAALDRMVNKRAELNILLEKELGLTWDNATAIKVLMDNSANAVGLQNQVAAASDLEAALFKIRNDSPELNKLWRDALQLLRLGSAELGRQADEQERLAQAAADTLDVMKAVAKAIAEAAAEERGRAARMEAFSKASLDFARRFADESELMAQSWDDAATNTERAKKEIEAYKKAMVKAAKIIKEKITDGINTADAAMDSWISKAEYLAGVALLIATRMGNAVLNTARIQPPGAPSATNRGLRLPGSDGAFQSRDQILFGGIGSFPVPGQFGNVRDRVTDGSGGGGGGGGGGGSASEDALKKYMEALKLKQEMLKVDQDTAEVMKALTNSTTTYTDAAVQGAVDATRAFRLSKEQVDLYQESMDSFASTLSDGFVDAITGAESWGDAMKGVLKEVLRQMLDVLVVQQIIGGFNFGSGTGTGLMGALFSSFSAKGNAFQGGNVIPFAKGGVVGGPTAFPMSGGRMGLMGESGPEAIMPLKRSSSGELGISGPPVVVNNFGNDQVTVNQSEEMTEIIIGRAVRAVEGRFAQSMSSGQGTFARSLESGYSARRKAV